MNRVNVIFIIFLSFVFSFILVYKYIDSKIKREPQRINVPLRIEVYRADRNVLSDADIYLNQRFIGRTEKNGIFSKKIELVIGKKYTIRIEKDRDGYFYGPWETHFVPIVKSVKKKSRKLQEKIKEESKNTNTLEGESDILTEIERAKLGIASIYEKYHFLAILPGYMYYKVKVLSYKGKVIDEANVIIDGKEEGKTDKNGEYIIKYEGDSTKIEKVEIAKEGEHLWIDKVKINPNAVITIELNKMLIIDLYVLTENYDVIEGVPESKVYIQNKLMGMTKRDGFVEFKYRNEKGVNGYLKMKIKFPYGDIPRYSSKTFLIEKKLPKLIVHCFTYSKYPPRPKISVFPFRVKVNKGRRDFLKRNAIFITRRIEDYLRVGRLYRTVPADKVMDLFNQFDVKVSGKVSWKDNPILKKAVDSIIIGELKNSNKFIDFKIKGINYDGIVINQKGSKVNLRELKRIPEDFTRIFMRRFQIEGNIISVSNNVYINLGSKHGVHKGDIFYGYENYFDNSTNKYEKRRVVRLKVIEIGSNMSVCEVESITEGYLLESGVKVKRSREIISKQDMVDIQLRITESGNPVSFANIYIDDKWKGQTNDKGEIMFKITSYTDMDLLVYKDGYIPYKGEVKVEDKNKKIKLSLKRGHCKLYLDSDPDGAMVYIDGKYVGKTPMLNKPKVLDYGFHLIEVKMEGYRSSKKYIKLNSLKMNLTGDRRIKLYRDLYRTAEKKYEHGNIDLAIDTLKSIQTDHPDYLKALNFLGYIYLNDKKDYATSIEYYKIYLKIAEKTDNASTLLYVHYNLGQAYFDLADKFYYIDDQFAMENYNNSLINLSIVRNKNYFLPKKQKKTIFINALFYLSVSYQKMYYLAANYNYLLKAYNSWIDYFDFFDKDLKKQKFYKRQFKVANSYFNEIERIRNSEK